MTGAGGPEARARGWLEGRGSGVPETLRRRLLAAVEGMSGDTAAVMVAGAIGCIEEALRLGADRAAATPLLAADALLTYAVEASAEAGSSLDALSADVGRRLAELLA